MEGVKSMMFTTAWIVVITLRCDDSNGERMLHAPLSLSGEGAGVRG